MIDIVLYHTFTTNNGYSIHLAGNHYIPVVSPNDDDHQITYISAPKVTLKHRLIILGQTVHIQNITRSYLIGFYSPWTLSGSLLVNNISTSVYVAR